MQGGGHGWLDLCSNCGRAAPALCPKDTHVNVVFRFVVVSCWQSVYEDDKHVYLVMELCSGGDLDEFVKVGGWVGGWVGAVLKSHSVLVSDVR